MASVGFSRIEWLFPSQDDLLELVAQVTEASMCCSSVSRACSAGPGAPTFVLDWPSTQRCPGSSEAIVIFDRKFSCARGAVPTQVNFFFERRRSPDMRCPMIFRRQQLLFSKVALIIAVFEFKISEDEISVQEGSLNMLYRRRRNPSGCSEPRRLRSLSKVPR